MASLVDGRTPVISPRFDFAPSEVTPLQSHTGDVTPLLEYSRPILFS